MFAIRCTIVRLVRVTPLTYQRRKASLFQRFTKFFFDKNLLLTNCITSGLCMAIGDIVEQEFEYQSKILSKRYDWDRAVRMFIVGIILGPPHHYYYLYIDKLLPKVNMKSVTLKLLSDQLIASPIFLLIFFYGMSSLEHKSFHESTAEIKKKFVSVYVVDWLYWPPVQFINFYFLPPCYRVVYINVATMIFNIFLSFMKHYDQY